MRAFEVYSIDLEAEVASVDLVKQDQRLNYGGYEVNAIDHRMVENGLNSTSGGRKVRNDGFGTDARGQQMVYKGQGVEGREL